MSNFAIKGHSTRGKEIIEILQMFGGTNKYNITYTEDNLWYCLRSKDNVIIATYPNSSIKTVLSIEEFLEKFPYKVGDKVIYKSEVFPIIGMKWDCRRDIVIYTLKSNYSTIDCYDSTWMKPYKEETMKDYLVTEEDYGKTLEVEQKYIDAAERLIDQLADGTRWKCKDFDSQKMIALFLKKNTSIITEKEDSIIVDIPKGYEFAGVDGDNQQVVFEKIGCQYPKTYEECCEVLDWNHRDYDRVGYNSELLCKLQVLLLCRDAYWKIYGERMGLGKPWEPDWNNLSTTHEFIKINKGCFTYSSRVLVFPTEEMRDAFYENFKELIERCKELF